jgi:hypothetical protein
LRSEFIKPFVNCRSVEQHALDIALHEPK